MSDCIGPININPNDNQVNITETTRTIVVTDNNCCTTVEVTQPLTEVVQVLTGPMGKFPTQGPYGFTGSFDISGSLTVTGSINVSGSVSVNSITGSFSGSTTDTLQNVTDNGSTTTHVISSSGLNTTALNVLGNATITGSLTVSGSNTFKNIGPAQFVGSVDITGSLIVTSSIFTPSITGSLQGTASWAQNAVSSSYALTASYAPNAQTASYALQAVSASYANTASYVQNAQTASYVSLAQTASYVQTAQTASYVLQAVSASYANTASYYNETDPIFTAKSASLATTGSNIFAGNQTINGNITVNGTASITFLNATYESASIIYSSGSNVFGDASNDTQTLNGSVIIPTGSLTVTGSVNITGSMFKWNDTTVITSNVGKTPHVPYFDTDFTLATSSIYQSGSTSVIINQDANTTDNPEALYVWQPHPTSINVISGKGNLNNYLQLNIHNTNQGTDASSDVVATANNGSENDNYIDMGINSENFAGFLGGPNDAYLYTHGHNFWIGNINDTSYNLYFFNSASLNPLITLTADQRVEISTDTSITGSLGVTNGITASLHGTASWAQNAVTASYSNNSTSASHALTASYVANASSFPYTGSAIITGSLIVTGSINATNGVTASVLGTASWAQNAVSSSHAQTASYIQTAQTASYVQTAQTASYVLQAISASYATTSSYALNADLLDGKDSTVFATTGSNIFIGNETITGSLSITGSTTQVGNNTLAGNTTLSGSIIISGSTTVPATPTIKVYGDMETNGVIKFMPVNKSIDTSVSASYIYVSGSTNDLYFSQNGSGYNNVTRLRWLEGNLYTGLLNGGIITTQSSTVFQVSSGSGVIVNLNASLAANPYPTIQYLNWPNLSASIAPLSASYDQSFVSIDSNTNIYTQGTPYSDGQYNTLIPIGIVIHQNRSTINATQTFPSVGYGWKQRSYDFVKAFGPLKIAGYTLTPSGSSTGSLVLSGGTAWVDGRNYTVDPNNPSYIVEATGITTSKIYRYRQSGSGWAYDTNGGAGYATIDPTQYSNNGVLTPVGTNDWTIQRVFYFPNSATKAFYIYYGNATYANQAAALAAVNTEPFSEAPNTAANAVYVGYMLLRYNADFTTPASYAIYAGGMFRGSGASLTGGGGGSTALAGLSDVNLSSPTNGQPLVYNSSTLKWENKSTLTASLSGNASTATTASYASTASYVITAQTASYVLQVESASYASTASFVTLAQTASYVLQAVSASFASTASYVLQAVSSSYATTASYALNGGVTQIIAGTNITISPTNGKGVVTINSTGGGGGGGTPGGSDTQIQYNSGSTFAADSTFTFNYISQSLQQGNNVTALGTYSHAQGEITIAKGNSSHAEGYNTLVNGNYSHAEGDSTIATTDNSHTEGSSTATGTLGYTSTDAGYTTPGRIIIDAVYGDVSGYFGSLIILDDTPYGGPYGVKLFDIASITFDTVNTIIDLVDTTVSTYAATIGTYVIGLGAYIPLGADVQIGGAHSHAEGTQTLALGRNSHVEGTATVTFANYSHAEGSSTTATGLSSHAEGSYSLSSGSYSHAEGASTTAEGEGSHAEGAYGIAYGNWSHAEGIGGVTHAEGSHAEGFFSYTYGPSSHAEGENTQAFGTGSHTEGQLTETYGDYSHAEGIGTIASGSGQLTIGKYNLRNNTTSLFVIGNGTSDPSRSDIVRVSTTDVQITGSLIVTGGVTGSFSGSFNGSVTSASYAATASYSNNFTVGSQLTIDQTLTDYASVSSTIVGSNNLFTVPKTIYTSFFGKYTAYNGANSRAGEFIANINVNGSFTYTDISTTDSGNTSTITFEARTAGTGTQINAIADASGWTIKMLGTFM